MVTHLRRAALACGSQAGVAQIIYAGPHVLLCTDHVCWASRAALHSSSSADPFLRLKQLDPEAAPATA